MEEIDIVICEICGNKIGIPKYCNIGRYMPMSIWCDNCGQCYKYWKYFGCYDMSKIDEWRGNKIFEKDGEFSVEKWQWEKGKYAKRLIP